MNERTHVIIVEKRIRGLKVQEDVLRRIKMNKWVINVLDAQNPSQWCNVYIHVQSKKLFVFNHDPAKSTVAFVDGAGVSSQNT